MVGNERPAGAFRLATKGEKKRSAVWGLLRLFSHDWRRATRPNEASLCPTKPDAGQLTGGASASHSKVTARRLVRPAVPDNAGINLRGSCAAPARYLPRFGVTSLALPEWNSRFPLCLHSSH